MRETLGLADPFDCIALRKDIEAAFGVHFGDLEAANCQTAGDLFDALCRHLDEGAGGCATAMAFHRLRRALPRPEATGVWRPGSDLGAACRSASVDRLLVELARTSGLKLPRSAPGGLVRLGAWLVLSPLLVAPVWWAFVGRTGSALYGWSLPLALFVCGLALVCWAPRRLPDGCATLGGLARRTAALNFGVFYAAGAAVRHRDVWAALAGVLAESTCVSAIEIGPETRIVSCAAHAA